MTGRPTDCTPEMIASIATQVEAGSNYKDAALLSGISATTLTTWMSRGRDGEEPFASFLAAVTQARAKAKADAIAAVRSGVLGGLNPSPDWKAEAWFLERTFPDEYGPQQAVNVKVSKELESVLEKLKAALPADQYELALRAIVGEVGGEPPPGD